MIPFTKVGNNLTLFVNGSPITVASTHVNYRKIQAILPTASESDIAKLLDTDEIYKNGVYYIYMDNDVMLACFSKANIDGYTIVNHLNDLTRLPKTITTLSPEAAHVGTYADIEDFLTDWAERFI